MSIKVLIVDDQEIIRTGIASLMTFQKDIHVVGTAENGLDAVNVARDKSPDVILMDIHMPVMDGIMACKILKKEFPETKIMMLTTFNDEEYIIKSLEYGASGYQMKDVPIETLANSIIQLQRGTYQLGTGIIEKIKDRIGNQCLQKDKDKSQEQAKLLSSLSEREIEVLKYISQGYSNKEIGNCLFLSESTIKNYVSNILGILNLRDRTQAALLAVKAGLHEKNRC